MPCTPPVGTCHAHHQRAHAIPWHGGQPRVSCPLRLKDYGGQQAKDQGGIRESNAQEYGGIREPKASMMDSTLNPHPGHQPHLGHQPHPGHQSHTGLFPLPLLWHSRKTSQVSRAPQFSAPVFLACFRVSWSRPVGKSIAFNSHGAPTPYTHGAPTPYTHGAPTPYTHGAPMPYTHGAPTPYTHGAPTPYTHGAPTPYSHGAPTPYF